MPTDKKIHKYIYIKMGKNFQDTIIFLNTCHFYLLCSTSCHWKALCASSPVHPMPTEAKTVEVEAAKMHCFSTKAPNSHGQTIITLLQLESSFTALWSLLTHLSVYLISARDLSGWCCPVDGFSSVVKLHSNTIWAAELDTQCIFSGKKPRGDAQQKKLTLHMFQQISSTSGLWIVPAFIDWAAWVDP